MDKAHVLVFIKNRVFFLIQNTLKIYHIICAVFFKCSLLKEIAPIYLIFMMLDSKQYLMLTRQLFDKEELIFTADYRQLRSRILFFYNFNLRINLWVKFRIFNLLIVYTGVAFLHTTVDLDTKVWLFGQRWHSFFFGSIVNIDNFIHTVINHTYVNFLDNDEPLLILIFLFLVYSRLFICLKTQ